MGDARVQRDEIEVLQSELREARARLAKPLDVEGINREVGARLQALAVERMELTDAIRGIQGLRSAVEEARLWCIAQKTGRSSLGGGGEFEVAGFVILAVAHSWAGLKIADWLMGFGSVPVAWPIPLAFCIVACAVVFSDVVGFIGDVRPSRTDASKNTEPGPPSVQVKVGPPVVRSPNSVATVTIALLTLLLVALSAYYGVGQFRAKKARFERAQQRAAQQHDAAPASAEHASPSDDGEAR